jgi:hypothetical protein
MSIFEKFNPQISGRIPADYLLSYCRNTFTNFPGMQRQLTVALETFYFRGVALHQHDPRHYGSNPGLNLRDASSLPFPAGRWLRPDGRCSGIAAPAYAAARLAAPACRETVGLGQLMVGALFLLRWNGLQGELLASGVRAVSFSIQSILIIHPDYLYSMVLIEIN